MMNGLSRNKLMVLNTVVVLITTCLNVILGMYEIRLLIARYGSTVNGLMQTGNQLMSYVALLESGIGASYIYSLYKPLSENNNAAISSLYNGYKVSLRKAVFKMLLFAAIVSFIYPLFLTNNDISYWFIVSILFLQSARKIAPYLITLVPQNMIIARERRYIASIISGSCTVITYLVEIIILKYTIFPLQLLLVICVAVAVISGLVFEIVMRKMYRGILDYKATPDLSPNKMSRDVMAGNISSLAFNSTDNIIISVLGSLSSVTFYSNYNTITNQVSNLVSNVINGTTASFGLKIANKDKNTYYVFREIFTGTLFIGGIIASVFIVMINEFITLWVGSDFCLSLLNVVLFAYIMYANIVWPLLATLNGAAGLYREHRNFTIFQTVLNLAITIALVPFIGITGALLGTLIGRVCVTIPKNYQLVYKRIFPDKKTNYLELVVAVVISAGSTFGAYYITRMHIFQSFYGAMGFMIRTIITTIIALLVNGVCWIAISQDLRRLLRRIMSIVRKK